MTGHEVRRISAMAVMRRPMRPLRRSVGRDTAGETMARDPHAALVALNRFGYGARGGGTGDLLSAASDPRGFVKADLARPAGALLELPGLAPTP
jgi:uncharacterized protein (DUF1800 family)